MINAGFVDFLFTGVAVLPELLLIAGYVEAALLLFVPLLIGACLFSMYRQQTGEAAAVPEDIAETDAAVTMPPS